MNIALLGQAQGNVGMSNWTLLNGIGDRYFDMPIQFQVSLGGVLPNVQVSLVTVDADNGYNLRVDVQAVSVTPTGFTLRFHTWADTKLYLVKASWFAVIP